MQPSWARPKQQYSSGAGRIKGQPWPRANRSSWAPWQRCRCGNKNMGNACLSCHLGWWDQWKSDGSKRDRWSKGPPSWLRGGSQTTETDTGGEAEPVRRQRGFEFEPMRGKLGEVIAPVGQAGAEQLQEQVTEQFARARSKPAFRAESCAAAQPVRQDHSHEEAYREDPVSPTSTNSRASWTWRESA